jgi:N-acetylglutamate synthase-like GNAT family acetyltransferase
LLRLRCGAIVLVHGETPMTAPETTRPSGDQQPSFVYRDASDLDLTEAEGLVLASGLTAAGFRSVFPGGFVVATTGSGIIGVAGVETYGGIGLLRSVAVMPEYRRRSLGAALVRDRIAWARNRGLGELYLLTTSAAPWFAQLGFQTIDRSRIPPALNASAELGEACCLSAATMVLPLEGHTGQ